MVKTQLFSVVSYTSNELFEDSLTPINRLSVVLLHQKEQKCDANRLAIKTVNFHLLLYVTLNCGNFIRLSVEWVSYEEKAGFCVSECNHLMSFVTLGYIRLHDLFYSFLRFFLLKK